MLIAHTANELGHQLIQRHSVTAQVPYDDVFRMVLPASQRLVDLCKSVDAGCRIDFQIHIQHAALFARKSEPGPAFRQRDAQLHQQE